MSAAASPFYYLENFCEAVGWLKSRYSDVLLEDELAFINTLAQLPRASAGLLVRMIMRRGDLFRASRLRYAEIGCTQRALPLLVDLSWVDPRPSLSLRQLCALLRGDELQKAFSLRRKPRQLHSSSRQRGFDFGEGGLRPLEGWWPDAPDQVLHLRIDRLCQRLRLMFFGNFHQDWSAFVLSDLGIHRYEAVAFGESRAFQTREQIDQFERLFELRMHLQDDAPPAEVLAAMPASLGNCDWIESRRAQLLYRIGLQSERAGDLQRAITAYTACHLPQARIRSIRVLERTGKTDEALERLSSAEASCSSEFERQHAARIRARLMRRIGRTSAQRDRLADVPQWKTFELELPMPDAPGSVECLVRDHLQASGSQVVYVENALINALFGLLFWRAIFAPVPGAFFHPFQAAPVDLLEADFCARRRREIDACFAQLEDETYRHTILGNLARKAGISSPFIAWGRLTAELLQWALDCVPSMHLRAMFSRLLCDLRTHRTGLPDLIQFWPSERRYRMIEVKGPGDRLQDNQIRWLRFCAESHIPVEVCRVRWGNVEGSPPAGPLLASSRSSAVGAPNRMSWRAKGKSWRSSAKPAH